MTLREYAATVAFDLATPESVAAETRLPVTDSVNVAPTIARVLGLKFDNVDGKPLLDALK